MTVLVLGPNGSGKSVYAEKLAVRLSGTREPAAARPLRRGQPAGELYYIATMIPYGDEGLARVAKHRERRKTMGFITAEKASRVSGIPFRPDDVVLLEDVSNLAANTLFSGGGSGGGDDVFSDITQMCAQCRAAVIVSIDGLTAKPEYDGGTYGYIDTLNRLNQRLSDFADTVITMREGKPVLMKGAMYDLD